MGRSLERSGHLTYLNYQSQASEKHLLKTKANSKFFCKGFLSCHPSLCSMSVRMVLLKKFLSCHPYLCSMNVKKVLLWGVPVMSSLPAFHVYSSSSSITYSLASSIKVNLKSATCKSSKTVLLFKFNLNLTSNWTLAMARKLDPRIIWKTCPYQRKGSRLLEQFTL